MRNKGFFWFLTILLTAVCIYQLSFTWVSNSVENKADKQAVERVNALMESAKSNNNIAILNGDTVDFTQPEAYEIAKATIVNQILKEKAETPVYPFLGSSFSDVKAKSLAFGLDLVGGMSVTLEISIPELVQSYARSPKDPMFRRVYDSALKRYNQKGGDFVAIFADEHKKLNKGTELVRLFAITDIEELGVKSTDEDVVDFLNSKVTSSMEGVEQIMNRRINQFGVAQPNIQKDPASNRLYIELPGVQDEATVADRLQSTANLQFFETYFANELQGPWQQASILSRQAYNEDVEPELVDSLAGTEGDSTTLKSLDESLAEMGSQKGLSDYVKSVGNFSMGAATAENRPAVEAILARKDILGLFPEDVKFMWSADIDQIGESKSDLGYFLYAIRVPQSGKARVGGKDISNARTGFNPESGGVTVNLDMTNEGSDKWALMTSENVNRIVAITMDDMVYSAPNVNGPINQGSTEISGNFTIDEAKSLAGLLNGGALPAPCVIKEQTKVGPTIGAENSRAGLISFAIALALVFVYMLFYYGKAGIVADIALLANILFIFGTLASFGAVLTLAGIAGIVLTIGMAVDANVLIYERIREEIAGGKDNKSAIETGFKKALSSIIDANVTTLLTAIVLKVFGSGPIESFATTLIIGIFTSLFAALVISRLIIGYWLSKGKSIGFDTPITKGAFKKIKINFVGKRKLYYAVSGILIALGLASLVMRGLNMSVEFSGGRNYGVKFEQSLAENNNIDYLKSTLSSVLVEANGKSASVEAKTKSNSYFVEITTNYMKGNEKGNSKALEKLKEGLEKTKDRLGAYNIMESRSVSPTISSELKDSSMIAIIISLIIIFAYILIRFGKWQYSTGAIVAMMHDVILVLAAFSLLQGVMPFNMDIDQAFIAAILTVIGYSINDTVVVFDRIRENLNWKKDNSHGEQINEALNSTLSRTINTSMTTFIVLLIIFLLGGAAIKGFVFALLIGVVVGTYSSLCIATPILIDLTKKIKA